MHSLIGIHIRDAVIGNAEVAFFVFLSDLCIVFAYLYAIFAAALDTGRVWHSIFTLHFRPQFDFVQMLLSMGEDVEVLAPASLRENIAGMIERMWKKYN